MNSGRQKILDSEGADHQITLVDEVNQLGMILASAEDRSPGLSLRLPLAGQSCQRLGVTGRC